MAIKDGDDAALDDILSYQTYNRLKNHWPAATAPSNKQEGMIHYDTDVDRPYIRDGSGNDIELWSKNSPIALANLLTNSRLSVWPQSDTNKGLGTMAYDSGSVAPVVGEALTGDTSSATGNVISYTLASGTWGGGDAAGVITLGAVTGTFIDNEDITGSTGGANILTVNGDSAIGLFNDPMNDDDTGDWTLDDCTLAFDTDHYEITRTDSSQIIYQTKTCVTGKLYKIECDIKNGTEAGVEVKGFADSVLPVTYTTGVAWAKATWTFRAPNTSVNIGAVAYIAGAANIEVKNFSCYEITPCCTAADAVALDDFVKDTTCDIYRLHRGGADVKGVQMVVNTASDYVRWPGAIYNLAHWYYKFRGKTITVGGYLNTDKASHAKITITDSAGSTSSAYHTGGGTDEWREVTHTVDASATSLAIYIYGDQTGETGGDTIIEFHSPMFVLGSSIGEGNYAPIPQEEICTAKKIPSNKLDGKTSQSDIAVADLSIAADSDGMLPDGCMEVKILTQCNDAGSAGTDCYLRFRADATKDYEYYNSPYGRANDTDERVLGWQQCDSLGDIDYKLEASGAGAYDIDQMDYVAVRLR